MIRPDNRIVERGNASARGALPRHTVRVAQRYAWLIAAMLCLWLGYLLIWQRGFYSDDYTSYTNAIDVLTGQWRPLWSTERIVTFPVRTIAYAAITTLAGLQPTHEPFVRALMTLAVGGNALLLGWLIYRMLGSRLAAVTGGWLFLMPLFAQEAVLWTSGVGYLLRAGLALLFLHCCWSPLTSGREMRLWLLLATLAFTTMLFAGEQLVTVIGVVPLLGVAASQRQLAQHRSLAMRSLYLTIPPIVITILVYVLFYRNADFVAARGEVDIGLAGLIERAHQLFTRTYSLTISPAWGLHLVGDVLSIGIATLRSSWLGGVLAAAAVAAVLLTAVAWQTERSDYRWRYRLALAVCGIGIVWFLAPILLPIVLLSDQQLEYRLLYFPTGGAAVMISALAWMIAKRLTNPVWAKLCIVLVGSVLLLSTIGMLGYARAFARRAELDAQQVAALVRVLPPQAMPSDSFVVPIASDEGLFDGDDFVSRLMVGIFEASWSAQSALKQAYGRDFTVVTTSRWAKATMSSGYFGDYQPGANTLAILGQNVPLDRAVPFVYRNGEALLVSSLSLDSGDGSRTIVRFPVVEALREQGASGIDYVVGE